MLDLTSAEVTGALLFGTLTSAIKPMKTQPPPDLPTYILALCRAYRTTHATPRNMTKAADRLEAIGDRETAAFSRSKAREETGHDVLALKDIISMGLPRNLPEIIIPASGAALVALFDRLADAPEPYGVFGYAYSLETVSAYLTKEQIAAVQRLVPRGIDITRCLRVHAVGDKNHVQDIVDHVTGFGQKAREIVIDAIQRTTPLLVQGVSDPEGLAKLTAHLAKIGWAPPVALEIAS